MTDVVYKPSQINIVPAPAYRRIGSDFEKKIAIEARSHSGGVKQYVWWSNYKSTGNADADTYGFAALITRIKLGAGADVALGLPVNKSQSDPAINYVAIMEENGLYGLYIEAGKRNLFDAGNLKQMIPDDFELRWKMPNTYESTLKKVMDTLPFSKELQVEEAWA